MDPSEHAHAGHHQHEGNLDLKTVKDPVCHMDVDPARAAGSVEHNGRTQRGQAVSTDIIEASAQAFLQAINHLAMRRQARLNPQTETVSAL